jgi:ferrochelatase
MNKIGVLITNTGTPDAPTTTSVRRYLREFLSDKRIVQLPRLLWLPILYGVILPTRPSNAAKLYQRIWTPSGSPMRVIMQKLQYKLRNQLSVPVEIGMNYGNPSIQTGLNNLRQQQVEKIIILPLYPQYSNTTTASTFDRVVAALKKWPSLPELFFHSDYAHNERYIQALAKSIQGQWLSQGASPHLLISFHGIPKSFVKSGDPYQSRCELTATLLATALKMPKDKWTLCYQSQFGYSKWLQPATFDVLAELPKRGIKEVDVVSPGFAIDCLETLEEISLRYKEIFLEQGGQALHYIPALNDTDAHIDMLAHLILEKN